MLDKLLISISMLGLIAFIGVVIGFVAEPDLIIVSSLMIALALHDFWISVFRPVEEKEPPPPAVPLEALPTGVSGKPATDKEPTKKRTKSRRTTSKRKK